MNARTLPVIWKNFRLYDVPDKKLIVLVWVATRCPIAAAHNARLNAIVKEYAPRGVQFIGINSNVTEPIDEVKVHAKQSGYQFPVLKDEGNKIADTYEANVTPEVFVMDNHFVLRYHGRIDDGVQQGIETGKVTKQELHDALEALLSNKPVVQVEVRALGCSIKRAKKPRE
jgi:peroxiredoxin